MSNDIQKDISRREFFKNIADKGTKMAKVGLVTSGTILLGSEAIDAAEKSFFTTTYANFFPIPEVHPRSMVDNHFRIDINDLPTKLDIFFKELVYVEMRDEIIDGKTYLVQHPATYTVSPDKLPRASSTPEIFTALAQRHSLISYGDINPPTGLSKIGNNIDTAGKYLSASTVLSALIFSVMNGKFSRREFNVMAAGTAIGAWAFSNDWIGSILIPLYRTKELNPQAKAIKRVLTRILDKSVYLHPLDTINLYRSAYFASVLTLQGKTYNETLGRKPNIAYSCGAFHDAVRDFIFAGEDFTNAFLLLPGSDFFADIAQNNDAMPECFGAARVLKFPSDNFVLDDFYDNNKLPKDDILIKNEYLSNAMKNKLINV